MNKRLHKILSGVAVTTLGATACIMPIAGAFAGEIQQKGVYAWGANSSGLLGNGTTSMVNTPKLSATSLVDVKEVATSDTHTLFLDRNGNVYASGKNSAGQLGNGKTTDSSTPVKVTLPMRYGVPDYATQVWAGDNVSYMRGSYGNVYAWGSNANGRTGQGITTGSTLTPKKVAGIIIDDDKNHLSISDSQVAFISDRTVSLNGTSTETKGIFTLGVNTNKVANQNSSQSIISKPVLQLIPDPEEESTYEKEVCSPDTSEWASEGDTVCDYIVVPKKYEDFVGLSPETVSLGNDFGIAVADDKLYTWGEKIPRGQLGRAVATSAVSPIPTNSNALKLENGATPQSISAGDEHALVLGSDGLIYGWGDNSRSETAPYYTGSSTPYLNVLQRLVIQKEVADNSSWDQVYATNDSSYGVTSEGQVYGWGDNSSGELAHSKSQVNTPTRIAFPYDTEITSFSANGNNAFAVTQYTETYNDISIKTSGSSLGTGSVGTAYNYSLASSGGYPNKAHKWTVSGLPKGLSFNSSTGKITGTPTVAGTYKIEVHVTDNVDEASKEFDLKINKATPTLSATYTTTSPGKATAKFKVSKGNILGSNGNYTFQYGSNKYTGKLDSKGEATVYFSGTAGSKVSTKFTYNGSNSLSSASTTGSATFGSKRSANVSASYSSPHPGQVRAVVTVKDGKANASGYVYLKSGSAKSSKVKLSNGKATVTWGGRGYGKNVKVQVAYEGSGNNHGKTLASKTVKTKSKYSSTPSVSYKVSGKKLTTSVYVKTQNGLAPSGKVYLYDGTKKIGTANLSKGKATFKSTLKKGTHKMKVTYAGNTYYNAKTSSTKSVKIK